MIRMLSALVVIAWIFLTELRLTFMFGQIKRLLDELGLEKDGRKVKVKTVKISPEHQKELTDKLIELLKDEEDENE